MNRSGSSGAAWSDGGVGWGVIEVSLSSVTGATQMHPNQREQQAFKQPIGVPTRTNVPAFLAEYGLGSHLGPSEKKMGRRDVGYTPPRVARGEEFPGS